MYSERIPEFSVNNYITLKLENGKTNIYVTGKLFKQCKYLLIKIPISDITSFEDIESIDEAAKGLNHSLENDISEYTIPPEVEFWGHSSNLQAWYEYGYDLRLLHSNLAFPLLQKLDEVGDPLARQVLKEELVKRLIDGAYSVLDLLINKAYINYFNKDELWYIINNLKESKFNKHLDYISARYYFLERLMKMGDKAAEKILKEGISKALSKGFNSTTSSFYEKGYINYLSREEFWSLFGADGKILQKIEQQVRKYKLINRKKVYQETLDNIEYFKLLNEIFSNSGFMIFTFKDGEVEKIAIFGDEKSVAEENMDNYYGNIGYLELEELTDLIGELKSMKELFLRSIGLKKLPRSMMSLKNLKFLSLTGNPQLKLPDFLWNLKSLEILDLSNNKLTILPESIENLENIKELYIYNNHLKSLPLSSITKLKKLRKIYIDIELADTLDDKTYEKIKNILDVS